MKSAAPYLAVVALVASALPRDRLEPGGRVDGNVRTARRPQSFLPWNDGDIGRSARRR